MNPIALAQLAHQIETLQHQLCQNPDTYVCHLVELHNITEQLATQAQAVEVAQ